MMSKLARFPVAAFLIALSGLASAGTHAIDLFTVSGVPGTGGNARIDAPCYCQQQVYFSPVMLLDPGTYDFGRLRDYWVASGTTPDGGPDQGTLYLFFNPLEIVGFYPDDFQTLPDYVFPSYVQCHQDDVACNASVDGAFVDMDLIYTVLPGQNAIQIGLIGHYQYTAPVPEPRTFALLVLGLALMTGIARRRTRR